MTTLELCAAAKKSSASIALASSGVKNEILMTIARLIRERESELLAVNAEDVDRARGTIADVMIDRLSLNHDRLEGICSSLEQLCALSDPVGEIIDGSTRPNGLQIFKRRVPLGVIAMIYESRPNVTVDAAALCIKSGNAVVLRGGKEAFGSNRALAGIIREALSICGIEPDCVGFVEDTSRNSSVELMNAVGYIDLLIPRGGRGLIRAAVENARVPVLETGAGVCTVYVDEAADLNKAVNIVENAKMSRPSVCNSAETVLVHRSIAAQFLPMLEDRIGSRCIFRADEYACQFLKVFEKISENDFATEYNDYILNVGVVDGTVQAIEHINRYGTHHSDSIVTENVGNAREFLNRVDSAAVYLNASTRFTDGGEFGLSAEIGISTQKLHARGPVGLRELTTAKYVVLGDGQIR